jgi:hypothetical protein
VGLGEQRTAQRKRWWVGWRIQIPLPCVGLGPGGGSDSGGTAWVDRDDFAVGFRYFRDNETPAPNNG